MAIKRKVPVQESVALHSKLELLQVADTVAREKGVSKEEILIAMEQAIQKTAKTKYGNDHDIRAFINRQTGDVSVYKQLNVVKEVVDPLTEMTLEDARDEDPSAQLEGIVKVELPPVEFCRVAAQTARQVIVQKVKEAERKRQYEEYKDRVGQIISGIIKSVEFGNVIVDLGRAEGFIHRNEVIQREVFRVGERIRSYMYDIKPEAKGPLIQLSRTHPQFLAKLFEQEVPEIYDGIIEIKGVARDPGSRSKVAVYTNDASIDAIGSCVGLRGSRIQPIVAELQGEKIDLINWSSNVATFVVNALAPAEVSKVVIDEDKKRVDVVVPEDQLSLAIGRRGQNVRLASSLTGCNLDILTEDQESSRRHQDQESKTKLFVEALDIDEMMAQLLISEGFSTVEEITLVPIDEFTTIEGFDEEIAAELQNRAAIYLEKSAQKDLECARKLGAEDSLITHPGITSNMLYKLTQKEVKTLDDLADLSGDELQEILGWNVLTLDQANEIIMAARAHWFDKE